MGTASLEMRTDPCTVVAGHQGHFEVTATGELRTAVLGKESTVQVTAQIHQVNGPILLKSSVKLQEVNVLDTCKNGTMGNGQPQMQGHVPKKA